MKKSIMTFKSVEQYDRWVDQFEDPSDYAEFPVAIDDGWKVAVDMSTECKAGKQHSAVLKRLFPGSTVRFLSGLQG